MATDTSEKGLESLIVAQLTTKPNGQETKSHSADAADPQAAYGQCWIPSNSADYDNSTPPSTGQAIVWNGTHYAPGDFGLLTTRVYSVPESAFTSFSAVTTRQQICAYQIPPQPFDWKPIVFGQVRVVGVELDSDPLIIGCEVRIGNPSAGTLVGRGFGNVTTWTTIIPHFSTPTSSSDAITPENATALVPAYHSGSEGTVYASVYNDSGFGGAYNFSNTHAQLVIMVVPVSGYQQPE